jgi:diguanylate cyclase (GGDEF)-like protein
LAYIFPLSIIVLAVLGYIPQGIEIAAGGIKVNYGIPIVIVGALIFFTLGARDIYPLVRKFRTSPEPAERNQIAYLFATIAILIPFILVSFAPFGGGYPFAHIGNFIIACILTYAVVVHRLLDFRVLFRRVLMWLGLGIAGVAAYLALFFLAHLALGFDISPATVAAATGIAVIAAIFVYKLQGVFHTKVEETFSGEKYHYRRQLVEFIPRIRSVSSLQEFGTQFISLLSQSIDCQSACLLLPEKRETETFLPHFTYPPGEDNAMLKLKFRQDNPVVTWLQQEARVLLKRHLSILPEFQSIWQEEKEDIESAKVEMFVPLITKNELVAILAAGEKRDSQRYTIEDIDLLESAATRAAASMEKEYLYQQLQEREEELAFINRVSAIIAYSLGIEATFDSIAAELKKVIPVDWATVVFIEGDELRFFALSSTIGSVWQAGEKIPLEGTATEWVCREKKSLYEADLMQQHKFWTGEQHLQQGIRSIIYLPLITKGEGIGALISAACQPNAYTAKQIALLSKLAEQIAAPVENAYLYYKAERRSRIDELTGLFNRRHFEERLQEEIARHSRYGGEFSLAMLDLDHLKTYNDIYGHPAGDKLLNQIGGIIRASIRSADRAFRYGGDEFTIILPNTTVDDAYTVAERVREQIANQMKAKGIAITCSIGLAGYPSDSVMSYELITAADTALYYAKRTGGDRVYLFAKILSEPVAEAGIDTRCGDLSAVYALAAAVDARDSYTYDHSKKVNICAVALAEAIGLPPDEVSKISTAAILHDIGKIGIPDKILNKKGRLDAEDWEAIKSHPRLGSNIIGNIPTLIPCLGGVLYHHERWDGSGYPEGLKGKSIPLEARILAIADAFAAMTSGRSYRDAYSQEKVIEELREGAGTQFDPQLVELFLGLIEAGLVEKVS